MNPSPAVPPLLSREPVSTAPAVPANPQPGFLRAFRGFWLLAWKHALVWRRLPALALVITAIPLLVFFSTDQGTLKPFIHWTVGFYFLLILPIYCLSVCGGMIRDELQADTLSFFSTRPITRAQLFLLKYLTQMLILQTILALHLGLLWLVGLTKDLPEVNSICALLLVTQLLAVPAWTALSSLLGLISSKYIVLGLIYGFIVELGIGRIPTNINTLSITRHLQTLLGTNRDLLQVYDWTVAPASRAIIALVLAPAIFLTIAAMLFTFREYHHTEEMQK
jgi:ABC-type transport system involved in multi-copper enzyme maturation permease subunit